jgi:NitT/TauT family transport system substrate-binding protein
MSNPPPAGGLTFLGKFISFLLVVGLLALGGYLVLKNKAGGGAATQTAGDTTTVRNGNGQVNTAAAKVDAADLAETKTAVPHLAAPIAYVPKGSVIDIELSQYAGYAGLIAANNGLDPTPDSPFAKKYNFQLRIKLSEAESWNALNAGKMAASATTADVLAVYGRQLNVVVPAQISYSRGADGIVTRSDIKRINALKGKIVAATQFTESDFFIRYLATQADIGVNMLTDPAAAPSPDKINMVYCEDGEAVSKLLVKDSQSANGALAAGVTWAPFTTNAVHQSNGKLALLTTNKNLLIVADILIVNKGFAEAHPDMVAGLVDGLLTGNDAVSKNPEQFADLIARSFSTKDDKWDRAKALAELQKVHLSNLPENLAFFHGGIADGGSFASIYQSAVLAYGTELIPNPVDSDRFLALDGLKKAQANPAFAAQTASLVPLQSSTGNPIEKDPLLSRDIRFYFQPNSDKLDAANQDNLENLASIKKMLDVSPGSKILLRGHVDDTNKERFRKEGGEAYLQKMALEAMDLSKRRASEIKNLLISKQKIDPARLDTVGIGWQEPASKTNPDLNRRVEVQWFTLE